MGPHLGKANPENAKGSIIVKKFAFAFLAFAAAAGCAFAAPRGKVSWPENSDPLDNTTKENTHYYNDKKDKEGNPYVEYIRDKVLTPEQLAKTAEAAPKRLLVKPRKVRHFLVWDRTDGFRHTEGIPAFRAYLEAMEKNSGGMWKMHFTSDRREFETLESLKKYDCVIINNCTGRFFVSYKKDRAEMTGEERRADDEMNIVCRDNLIKYVAEGGGIMGAHAACDAMDVKNGKDPDEKFPAYPEMMGGRFAGHPWGAGNPEETFIIEDPRNPVLKGIWSGDEFKLQDEIYTFIEEYGYNRNKQRILISLDFDRSPLGNGDDPMKHTRRKTKDFGVAWLKNFGKGRIFYGAFGHRLDVYWRNPEVCEMYMRGLQFASGDLTLRKSEVEPLGDKALKGRGRK